MAPRPVLYFAYGSNMLSWRLRHPQRCSSARKVSVAVLEGHALRFHKVGSDGSGKCDVARAERAGSEAEDSVVHGVVYEVHRSELMQLDGVEGAGYERREMVVRTEDGGPTEVFLYAARASAIDPDVLPYSWYRDLVVAGAQENGLAAGYADRLAAHPAVGDPEPEREERERAAIARWLEARDRSRDD